MKAFKESVHKAKIVHEEYLPANTTDFTAGAQRLIDALKKTGGATNTEKLISAMEGMSFETPKGKMTFRKEDHQALQAMYQWRMKANPPDNYDLLELVREIPPEEMKLPIKNKR